MYDFLSFGAGVQTFAMLIMIKQGTLEKPGAVIFADTQGESPVTYEHIEQVAKPICKGLDLPFITVSRGDLFKDTLARGNTMRPPYCSWMYKRDVINAKLKEMGATKDEPAQVWICIGAEEAHRGYKPSAVSWVKNVYPLLDADITRYQLVEIIRASDYPMPIKSGCWYCPWRGKTYWLSLKQSDPERFKLAVGMEALTGHKIPNGPFTVVELANQTQIDWDAVAGEDEDEQCTTGYCEVIS